jgi:CheY-like chemotaxis protein
MTHKSSFAMRPLGSQKRVLLVVNNREECARRSEFLRRRGYEVDCATHCDSAVTMSRARSYDVIVLPLELEPDTLDKLSRKLAKLNPNAAITCLADCTKPLPAFPGHRLLWLGEPLEYFIARVDALSKSA